MWALAPLELPADEPSCAAVAAVKYMSDWKERKKCYQLPCIPGSCTTAKTDWFPRLAGDFLPSKSVQCRSGSHPARVSQGFAFLIFALTYTREESLATHLQTQHNAYTSLRSLRTGTDLSDSIRPILQEGNMESADTPACPCSDLRDDSSGTLHVFLRDNSQEFCKPDLKHGYH